MSAPLASAAGLRLLDPWMLLWALLVPLALWWRSRGRRPAVRFAPGRFLEPRLPRSPRQRLALLPVLLQALGLLLMVVALARPVREVRLPQRSEGIDILLCLDASSSMAAHDLDPQRTRLDVARDAAARFIAGRREDRIGLIRFARFPDVACPLTLDHEALLRFVSAVELVVPDGPEDATGIGAAVARAATVLQHGSAKSKVLVLLTDGEENVATAQAPDEITPQQAGALCRAAQVRVYTIAAGVGRPAATGEFVPVDTSAVRGLAEATGGQFYAARDAGALESVYAQIDELEKSPLEDPRFRLRECFVPFLIAGLALLFLGLLLRATVLEVLP